MQSKSNMNTSGSLKLRIIKPELSFQGKLKSSFFNRNLLWKIRNFPNIWRGLRPVIWARLLHIPTYYGTLSIRVTKYDKSIVDYGVVSWRVVTDTGVAFIVDAFQNSVELEDMKYHALGTNNTAENQTDTALNTELTTEYNPNNTRATGTTEEGTTANIYKTVGTNALDASVALVEHGILDQAAVGGGVLIDRTVFSVINLVSGDSLESTYELTFTAGS